MNNLFCAAIVAFACCAARVHADVIYSDGFESYAPGALDKNLSGGPNAAPNGSGNPWFGPSPPNAHVVTTDSGVTPHSGNQMIRGAAPSDGDQNWFNLAYRLNGGNPFTGNVALDWWFYDALGVGGTALQDYVALGYYNTAPSNTDYPVYSGSAASHTGSLNYNLSLAQFQRLSLGTSSNESAGYNSSLYQARIVGASGGYASGWFNTTTPRTVGWHHGRIAVGPALPGGGNDVDFYIDDMATPTFSGVSTTTAGFNVIELNTNTSTQTAYFDDVSFSTIPEPGRLLLVPAGFVVAMLRRRRRA